MAEILLPKQWADIKIREELGEGSYGKVYKASTRKGEKKYYAVKIISIPKTKSELNSVMADIQNNDSAKAYIQSIVDNCLTEIQTMQELSACENIVRIEDYVVEKKTDEIGSNIYIRMELLTGLNARIKNNDMTEEEVIRLGTDLCKALIACEEKKIVHRDIKPENIFYSETDGIYKLGDFGEAKIIEQSTAAFSMKGTPHYMAPEVYKNQPYDHTVDIYSLGIVMYKLLNYNRYPLMPPHPQPIKFADQTEAFDKRIAGTAFPEPMLAHSRTAAVVLKACAYDPKKRYANANELLSALQALSAYLSANNADNASIETYHDESAVFQHKKDKKDKKKKKKYRNPKSAAAGFLISVFILSVILFGTYIFLRYFQGGVYWNTVVQAVQKAWSFLYDKIVALFAKQS